MRAGRKLEEVLPALHAVVADIADDGNPRHVEGVDALDKPFEADLIVDMVLGSHRKRAPARCR